MNDYCHNCSKQCDELIPTYNCEFQMNEVNKGLLINALEELKASHSLIEKSATTMLNVLKSDQNKVTNFNLNIGALPFNNRCVEYQKEFGLGNLGIKIDNKLILVSLICSFVLAARKKNPAISVLDCVKTLTDYETLLEDDPIGEIRKYYENLAILCESFLYGVEEGNTFGLKNAKDLKNKVAEILSTRLPF